MAVASYSCGCIVLLNQIPITYPCKTHEQDGDKK